MRPHPRTCTALAALALLMVLALPRAVVAQTTTGSPPSRVDLRLVDVATTIDPGEPAPLRLTLLLQAGEEARRDLRLVTTAFSRATGRSDLRGDPQRDGGTVYASVSESLPPMPRGAQTVLTVTIDPAELDLIGEDRHGVYPLQAQVFDAAEPIGAVTTSVVVLPDDTAGPRPDPLPATLLVDVLTGTDAVPLADQAVNDDTRALVAPGSPDRHLVEDLVAATADGSAAGLTLVLEGRTLADVATMVDGYTATDGTVHSAASRSARQAARVLADLRAVVARSDTSSLALPFGPADLVALVRGGEPEEAVRLIDIGRQTVRQVLGEVVDDGFGVPPDGLDADTLAVVGRTEPDALVLDRRVVSYADDGSLHPHRRLRTADGGEVRMVVPDDDLSRLLSDPQGVGVAALVQQLRAETALQWMADPDAATGVLLRTRAAEELPDGVVTAASAALADTPWLRPLGLASLADVVAVSPRVVRLAYPPSSQAAELPQDYVRLLGDAREALVPIRSLLPASDSAASVFGRSLLAASAIPYRQPDARAAGLERIEGVLATLDDLGSAVEVVEGPPVTLTSATGQVPVVLRNTSPVPLDVTVRVGSTGFAFDEPVQSLTLPANSVQTLTFSARARNPGAIAGVGVAVEDPSGALTLVSHTIAVRSTAFPVVGVVATVGGVVVLAMMALRDRRRRRDPSRQHVRPSSAGAA